MGGSISYIRQFLLRQSGPQAYVSIIPVFLYAQPGIPRIPGSIPQELLLQVPALMQLQYMDLGKSSQPELSRTVVSGGCSATSLITL